MSTFKLDIVTPELSVFSGEVTSVKVPGATGSFSVLHNHAPIIASLAKGELSYITDGKTVTFTTQGGVVEVLNNQVTVLVERILTGMEQLSEA